MSMQQQLARKDIYSKQNSFLFCFRQINTNKASLSPITKNQLCLGNQYH